MINKTISVIKNTYMKDSYKLLFTVLLALSLMFNESSFAQSKTFYDLFSLSEDNSTLNTTLLQKLLHSAVLLNVNTSALNEICENKYSDISLSIPYPEGRSVIFNLKRFDIVAPGAKLVLRTANGNEEVSWLDYGVTYTGNLDGDTKSFVVINITREKVTGLMSDAMDNYVIGILKDELGNDAGSHVLYKESDVRSENNFNCESNDMISPEAVEKMKKDILEQINDSSPNDLLEAKIAIDVDNITYNSFSGSVQITTNFIVSVMSAVSAMFLKEVNVKLTISYLRIWTVPDPYTGGNLSVVLDQFTAEWNANQGSVQRTVAHLISTRSNFLGGAANYNVLCNNNNGYGFTVTRNNFQPLPSYFWNVFAVTHEFGHNFGPNHTHNCSWIGGPIDTCWTVEGGCYNGPLFPKTGTIMSYCHQNGSISLVQGFGPQPRALIRSRAEAANCIQNSSRNIVLGYPNGLETFRKGRSIQIYWGTSLSSGNFNIELSTNNGSSWQTIQNNIPAAQRVFDWAIPDVSLTTQAKVRIINSANPAEGDTSDAAFTIQTYLNPFNITIGLEGFWNGSVQVPDTVRLYFRSNAAPYNIMDSSKVFLNSAGNIAGGISNTTGGNYFIQAKHRNAVETWSSAPVNFTTSTTTYNFTTLQSRAYGNNQILKSGKWCFYSGDVIQQGSIDLSDVVSVYNDAGNFLTGYQAADVNGDNIIDLNDVLLTHNNSVNFVGTIKP